jgi:hypothetical protein
MNEKKVYAYSSEIKVKIPKIYSNLLLDMLGETGVKVEDRYYLLKKYKSCFVCSQLIDWILIYYQFKLNKKISREEALELCETLREKRIFAHVVDPHKFKVNYF